MAISIRDKTVAGNVAAVDADGAIRTATRGITLAPTTVTVNAATAGVLGPVDITAAGNVTFIVRATNPATGWTGNPVVVFEQSDDGTSWTPLVTVRSDTCQVSATHFLGAGAANTALVFDAALEGVSQVRARLTTGTATGGLTLVAQPGPLAFSPVVSIVPPQRTALTLYGTALAVGATGVETLLTLSQQKGTAAVVAGTGYVIPAGKRLRVQSLAFTQVGNATAAAAASVFRMRLNPAGAVAVASVPILLPARLASPAAATSFQQLSIPLAEGMEIAGDGVASFGFTVQATYTTTAPTVDVLLVGYEY